MQKIFLLRNLMIVLESACCDEIASTHLETYSTANYIYIFIRKRRWQWSYEINAPTIKSFNFLNIL